jgi:hypothetical protein
VAWLCDSVILFSTKLQTIARTGLGDLGIVFSLYQSVARTGLGVRVDFF